MTDFEFMLQDRITKIRSMNDLYDLKNNAYVSFSGGKDSLVVSLLLDKALPENNIPRVFFDTGIEYQEIRRFVFSQLAMDKRIRVLKSGVNIKQMLEEDGYPFKSKQHSHNVAIYQHSGMTRTNEMYLGKAEKTNFLCPKILEYQFTQEFTLKLSDKCCYRLKKEVAAKWEKESKRPICITGMRMAEGGYRNYQSNCAVFEGKDLKKFHPLKPCSDDFVETFLKELRYPICDLYKEPFNFKRTGCLGCPFNINLKAELTKLLEYSPKQAKTAYTIWKPVYDEYARLNYRIDHQLLEEIKRVKIK